ncbi:MAG: ribbon-helix-helix domain-containing protein [Rhodospirillales bacterium]|nr:ribbon-helix-helix domain-containing protein [Rhodospirillales bacterium]
MPADPSRIRKHSVLIAGHETSVSLENAFWDILCRVAQERNLSINDVVGEIDARRSGNLSSAIRLYVLQYVTNRQDS